MKKNGFVQENLSGNPVLLVQREFDVPVSTLYNTWSDKKIRCMWFPCIAYKVTKEIHRDLAEFSLSSPAEKIILRFTTAPGRKSVLSIFHNDMKDPRYTAEMKIFWERVLHQLDEYIDSTVYHNVILDY